MLHRSSIAVTGESAAAYALVKLIPSGLSTRAVNLNLVLAVDVSGSMYEEDGTGSGRLKRVQDAASAALGKLRPVDTLGIVAFGQDARVILPPTPLADRERIEDALHRLDRVDVDPGGTAMDEGLALALREMDKQQDAGRLSQVLVLTDGETSGEEHCRALAREAATRKIRLSLMGVGLDWKASLLKDLARLGAGQWYYIDAEATQQTTDIFAEEFGTLAATAFLDVQMHLRPMKDVRLKRIRQVSPLIQEMPLEEPEDRHLVASLGALQVDASSRYILDLSLPRRADGKYVIAQMELTYDLGTGRRESTGQVPLEMTYAQAGNGHVNAEVIKHIDDIQLKEMTDGLHEALQQNDAGAAQQLAKEIVRKATQMGGRARKKTMLAEQVLEELTAEATVTRKTQLELDDAVRRGESPAE
jgi:Ca-activated chloride channel family protein